MLAWWKWRNWEPKLGGPSRSPPKADKVKAARTITITADGSGILEVSAARQLSIVEVPSALTRALQQQHPTGTSSATAAIAASSTATPPPDARTSASTATASSSKAALAKPASPSKPRHEALLQPPQPRLMQIAPCKPDTSVPMSRLIHSVASLSRAGRDMKARKINQDSCFAYQQYLAPSQGLFCAMDGHGPFGHHVSSFLKQHMPVNLVAQMAAADAAAAATAGSSPPAAAQAARQAPSPQQSLRTAAESARALSACFLDSDVQLLESVECQFSGSAVVMSLLEGRRLTTAWVGDSRAVLARQDPRGLHAVPLTRDHKPTALEEKARILGAGGRVERLTDGRGMPVGPARVWLASSWVPGLAMSRALGDAVAHTAGVSSEPEVSVAEVTPQDRFLILATDGVWEFIDCQLAVDIIAECTSAEQACRALVNAAWSSWSENEEVVDDITVVVIKFQP